MAATNREMSVRNLLALVPPDRNGERIAKSFARTEESGEFAKRGIRVHAVSIHVSERKELEIGTIHPVPRIRQLNHTLPAVRRYGFSRDQHFTGMKSWMERLQLAQTHRAIEQIIRAEQIDVVYSHFAWPRGTAGLAAARRTRTPVIVALQGADVLTAPSIGYGGTLNSAAKARISHTLCHVDHVIGISQALADRAIELGARPDATSVILKGANVDRFHACNDCEPHRPDGIPDRPTVLFVGSFVPVKGLSILLDAFHQVQRDVDGAQLVLCGDGPELHNLKTQASGLGLSGNVIMPGRIGRNQIADYFRSSNVLVLPSLSEGAGIVLVEAGACGIPSIGSDVGGIPDYIDDGKTGWLFEKNNVRDLADKIIMLLTNRDLAKSMGAAAQRRVHQELRYDQMIDKILQVFRLVIAQSRG